MAKSSQPLHQAIWKNDEDAFMRYLEKRENLNTEDEKGLKPLHIAIITSNEKFVKSLLVDKRKEVKVDSKAWCCLTAIDNEKIVSHLVKHSGNKSIENCRDDFGQTPLHHAIINRNPRFINLFCALGCSVNSAANNGFTPLHFAALANDVESIKKLLEKNALVDIKTMDGKTVTYYAVQKRHTEAASLLFTNDNVNDIVDNCGSSALHIAVANNDERMVELLLQKNANIMCRDLDGKNLLHVAAEHGHEKWIRDFIKKGIDVNGVTNDNSTPLLIALQNNKKSVANILLDYKANVNMRNNDWLSPLFAALQHNNTELCKRLISLGAQINYLTLTNSSVLHFAAKYCGKNMVAYLVQQGAMLGMRDHLGQNELHLAAKFNNSDVLELLLELGMNVNEMSLDKSTALHYAVSAKALSFNNVEVLIKKGINVDAENERGDTALNLVCRTTTDAHRYNIIEHLLIANADPNHVGSGKTTPLYSLLEKKLVTTAILLVKYGADCNRASSNGDSVLQLLTKFPYGCACTRTGVVKSFIELGADINSVNDNGESPIHTSLMFEKNECIHEIGNFLNCGARLTENQLGENVLHVALKYLGMDSYIETIFTFLLEKGASLYHNTKHGSHILHYAVQYSDNVNILKIILDKTENSLINVEDGEGKTALHIAAASGASSLVEVLLERDADVNCKDGNNDSALNLAIIGNHIETVQILLKKGASTTVKNKDGFNAYDLAEQKDRHIYQLLLNR